METAIQLGRRASASFQVDPELKEKAAKFGRKVEDDALDALQKSNLVNYTPGYRVARDIITIAAAPTIGVDKNIAVKFCRTFQVTPPPQNLSFSFFLLFPFLFSQKME